ncbi:BrnT family toxin [Methylotenera sp. G11]|uniref:BrnT family toxin n=1 Tax=Methylotenera sp. G11 TaxID=1506585 RepID=UPI000646E424|nr:BrnT family toxin [Methylotenera sp. G11]
MSEIYGKTQFEWDVEKNALNQEKHGVSFDIAQYAFADPNRVIAKDITHSKTEERFYCFGEVEGGVLTVRFAYRDSVIRIIGAGYWRKGKVIYERENKIHE